MKQLFLFGDSITAGYFQQEISDLLTSRIQTNFPAFQVTNAGIPGDTTVDALARIEEHILRYKPDYVTVCFGANDVSIGNDISLSDYRTNLEKIITLIGSERVILLSTPYANQVVLSHDRPTERLRSYVTAAAELSQEWSMPFINLFDEMQATGTADELLQADGLHFSEKGYDFLGTVISEALTKKINTKEA